MPSAFGSIRCVKSSRHAPYPSPGFAPDMVNRITPSVGPAVPLRVEFAILRRARGPDVQVDCPPRPPGSGQVIACLAANEASAFAALPTKAAVGGQGPFSRSFGRTPCTGTSEPARPPFDFRATKHN
jgi:hypothetical protein